jgi:hypothetical protein
MVNRLDFFAVFFSFSSLISAIIISGSVIYTKDSDFLRFGLGLLVLRIFTQVPSNRRLIYPIFTQIFLRQFGNMFVFLLLVMYLYAIYGTLLFADILDPAVLGSQTPRGNFNTLTDSMISLFNLIVNFDTDIFCKQILIVTLFSNIYLFRWNHSNIRKYIILVFLFISDFGQHAFYQCIRFFGLGYPR